MYLLPVHQMEHAYVMMHFNDKINKIKPIQQKQRELSTKLIDLSRLVNIMCKNTIQP